MRWHQRSITEDRDTIAQAREIRLLCPHCSSSVYAKLDWPFTALRRQETVKAAIEEHRKLCSGAPPEAGRVYEISYPRA